MDNKQIERDLLQGSLPDLFPSAEGWVMPRYDGLSVANLPATIAALLGSELPGALPPLPADLWSDWLPDIRRIVLILLDGLGYNMLTSMQDRGQGSVFSELAEEGRMVPLTSVFPSTTDAALVSMSTGRPPAEHGWLAYEIYLRELGIASNAINLSPVWSHQRDELLDWGLDPGELIPVPTLAQHLAREGSPTRAILTAFFRGSGFTDMLYRGVDEVRVHRHASDLWVQLRHLLAQTRGERSFVTVYWSGLDTIGHLYGHGTAAWEAEFRSIEHLLGREFLAELPSADREGTLLLITADHGQILVPDDHILTADENPDLSRHLQVPIMGEARAAFVYPRPGRAEAIRELLRDSYADWFAVVQSEAAIATGLMGSPVYDETLARAGELLVLGRGDHALQRSKPPFDLVSRHGGLTPSEMLVPLIGARLDRLAGS
jgi:hypothetical protein